MAAPSTPCVNICVVDEASGLCVGCGRSLDEIAAWSGLSEGERRAIMAVLERRLARLDAGEIDAAAADAGACDAGARPRKGRA